MLLFEALIYFLRSAITFSILLGCCYYQAFVSLSCPDHIVMKLFQSVKQFSFCSLMFSYWVLCLSFDFFLPYHIIFMPILFILLMFGWFHLDILFVLMYWGCDFFHIIYNQFVCSSHLQVGGWMSLCYIHSSTT